MSLRLDDIDLVIFDKDGTIIRFGPMWSAWAIALGEALESASGRPVADAVYAMLGVDPASGTVLPGGGLAATAMARLRDQTLGVVLASASLRKRRNVCSRRPGTRRIPSLPLSL